MLARLLRGLADGVAAKIEPRRTRKWVLCSLITAVYVSEGRGIYEAFNCLGLPPQGTTAPASCLLTAKIASVHPVELGRGEAERGNLEASCIAGNRVITAKDGRTEGESMAGTMRR